VQDTLIEGSFSISALNNGIATGIYLVKIECGINTFVETLIIA